MMSRVMAQLQKSINPQMVGVTIVAERQLQQMGGAKNMMNLMKNMNANMDMFKGMM